jgi:lactate dehydrogenase-like 2-hydroxyacid dehydrogenase
MFRIITDTVHEPDVEQRVMGSDVEIVHLRGGDLTHAPDSVWQDCDGILLWHFIRINEPTMAKVGPRCRIIVRAGVGFDNVDVVAAAKRGIPVCNTPDYGTAEVADHALAMALSLIRGLSVYTANLRADPVVGWRWQAAPVTMRRLRGAKVGIVGLGRIGLAAARRFAAFDTEVCFYDPEQPVGYELATGYRRHDTLEELLSVSDIVSVHCPLNDQTRGLIGKAAVAAMKPGTLYINTARGGVQDMDAIHEGLSSGRIAGAGLDVMFVQEPPPDHPLLRDFAAGRLDGRLILSPHAAFYSPDALLDMRVKSAETMMMYLRQGRLRACVNAEELKTYAPKMA